jgi:septal ring factor EnvC (AmiA/AmiB activator)
MSRLPLLMLLAFSLALLPPVAPRAAGAGEAQADLERTRDRIRALEARRSTEAREREGLERRLRQAEEAAGESRRSLEATQRELRAARGELARLGREIDVGRQRVEQQRRSLAAQLRGAWVRGPGAPLRLLLSPDDPDAAGQRLVWIGYVARGQQALVQEIDTAVAALRAQEALAVEREQELAALEAERRARVAELDKARRDRQVVLASLDRVAAGREAQLRKLESQAAALETLLRRLERSAQAPRKGSAPAADGTPLPPGRWPVSGKLLADFGQARAGGQLRWDGVLIGAPAGTEVRAARDGKVVYADWLPGLGLLLVIDHGRGYLSLYGHNQDLVKAVGSVVSRGDTVARVGDTGGQSRPALYFEVRRNGKPQNPRQWVR